MPHSMRKRKKQIGLTHTWSVLRNHNSSMVQSDIWGGGRALVGQSILVLHLEGDAAGAAVSGAGGAVGGAGRALHG